MKYNPSEAYALAIGHLADRMRGGDPFVQPWPREERVLSRAERYELQQLLAARGFDIGQPDGKLGGKTRLAIRQFQAWVIRPTALPQVACLAVCADARRPKPGESWTFSVTSAPSLS